MEKNNISELVEKAKGGNQLAFSKLFEYFYPKVLRITRSSFKDNELAEDMAMEAITKSFLKINNYSKDISFEFWVKRITINHIIDYVRVGKNKELYKNEIDDNVNSISEDLNPEMDMINREVQSAVEYKVDILPEKAKRILTLRQKGLTYTQIAKRLKINIGTVKSQIHKSMQKIKKEFN